MNIAMRTVSKYVMVRVADRYAKSSMHGIAFVSLQLQMAPAGVAEGQMHGPAGRYSLTTVRYHINIEAAV
jgi:hypothetical protein